jgi:hypothetical protein
MEGNRLGFQFAHIFVLFSAADTAAVLRGAGSRPERRTDAGQLRVLWLGQSPVCAADAAVDAAGFWLRTAAGVGTAAGS